jgi:hypothetical protein
MWREHCFLAVGTWNWEAFDVSNNQQLCTLVVNLHTTQNPIKAYKMDSLEVRSLDLTERSHLVMAASKAATQCTEKLQQLIIGIM